jgi:hypothetical protein
MIRDAEPSAVAPLAEALLECTAPMTQILDHMARAPEAVSVEAAVERLRALLESVLEPLEDTVPARDLASAAAVVERATDLIAGEILLVPQPGGGGRSGGRGGRGVSPRRRDHG